MFLHLNLIKPSEITNPRIYMYEISETEAEKWKTAVDNPDCQIIALTGADISAESGMPTFRGEDGYWKIGSSTAVFHIPAKVSEIWYISILRFVISRSLIKFK